MLGKRETNSFQNTLYIQSQRQRIYGQIIPLDRLFEKGNGGGAKGRKIIQRDVYVQYCGYNTKMEGYTHCRYNTKWVLFMQ